MRRIGDLAEARGCEPTDHICWIYDRAEDFVALAAQFLAEGLAKGDRLVYMGAQSVAQLEGHLQSLGDPTALIASGGLQVLSSRDMYESGGAFEPDEQVEAFRLLGETAVADGYRGLRAAADLTSLVRTPEQLASFARYERLIDQLMATAPLTGMCGYDRAEIGDEMAERIAALHPLSGGHHPSFRLCQAELGTLALSGYLDIDTQSDFRWALRHLDAGGPVVLDAAALSFVDHRNLLELEAHATEVDCVVDLRNCSPTVTRLVAWLELERVRVAAGGSASAWRT